MASLTVRQIDDALKQQLRLRAARHGRSVEDEVRTILREAAGDTETPPTAGSTPAPVEKPAAAKRVLLIIGGGIAAYKSLDLNRRLKERGLTVRCILTKAAEEFVTPLSAGAITGERVFTDLFDPAHEFDVGHIRLAREAELIVVAPATADLMAKMANGLAGDLATAVLLATKAQILLAPAMNPAMWANRATQRNLAQLIADGVATIGPNEGEMAESGERGSTGCCVGDDSCAFDADADATAAAAAAAALPNLPPPGRRNTCAAPRSYELVAAAAAAISS